MDVHVAGSKRSSAAGVRMRPDCKTLPARRFWLLLLLVLLAAAAFRVATLEEYSRLNPLAQCPQVDARVYWEMAGRMADGIWCDERPFLAAPLYPYLLGLLRWLGGGLVAVYVLQLLLHLLTGLLIGLAARIRFGSRIALLAVVLFFLLGEPAVAVQRVLASTLQIALAALVWWRWVVAADHGHRSRDVVACGAAIGAYALSQSAALLLVPLYGIWLVCAASPWRTRLMRAAIGIASAAALISPATIHNLAVSGEFIPISANAGINLYLGNAPQARGIITPVPDIRLQRDWMFDDAARAFERAAGRPGSWREIDRHYRRAAWRSLSADPWGAMRLLGRKAYYFLSARHYDDIMVVAVERAVGYARRSWLAPVATPWILGLALIGLLAVVRHPVKFAPEWILLLLPLLVIVLVFYTPRYRMPLLPVASALAIWGIAQWRVTIAWRIAIALAFALPISLEISNRAIGFDRVDRYENHFRRQLCEANLDAAELAAGGGDDRQAEAHYAAALDLWPDSVRAHHRYARFLLGRDRARDATTHLETVLRIAPMHVPAHVRLYDAYCSQQRYADAERTLTQLAGLAPQRIDVKLALAWLLATCPEEDVRKGNQALRYARAAREAGGAPEDELLDVLAAAHAETGDFKQGLHPRKRGP